MTGDKSQFEHENTMETLFDQARAIIPGGVNSPVRAFAGVGGCPVFMERGYGAYLWDVQGRRYIDYVGSWGPCILGHAKTAVIEAVHRAADLGTSFGTATAGEIELAKQITSIMPSVEMVRLVNSGTEATMSAVRLARAYTGQDRIIKFAGCYHGHGDSFLVQAGSGASTLGIPTSPGVPAALANLTLIADFNDLKSVERLIDEYHGRIAAVIIEPVVGNVGVIPPRPGFLESLRQITRHEKIVLIFDEVMTGFRVAAGGAQGLYGIEPDLTTLGKIIGGGLPVGAYGGRREIMEMIAPAGPVYQAGTLSGNPLAVAAGRATLSLLDSNIYQTLESSAAQLEEGIRKNLTNLSLPWQYQRVGSMASLFFTDRPVRNYKDALTCDTQAFAHYFHAMLKAGIYLPPSQFEAFFISAAHTSADIEQTIEANYQALKILR
jgi:glutamate-1-semialdehyde 2,1-aminomutase